MTSTLDDLISILSGIILVTADPRAQQLDSDHFMVTLTFSRTQLRSYGAWKFANAEPVPTWMLQQILSQLNKLKAQYANEERWSSQTSTGATLADCVAFLHGQLSRLPENSIPNTHTRKFYQRTLKHLAELTERRQAGGYRNPLEESQDKDSAKWRFEDSAAAEELRRQQEQARRKTQGQPDFDTWGDGLHNKYGSTFAQYFRDAYQQYNTFYDSPRPPPPNTTTRKRWHEVLGVPVTSSKKEIQIAARRLRSKYHPDRYKAADAHDRMTEINVACDEGMAGAKV